MFFVFMSLNEYSEDITLFVVCRTVTDFFLNDRLCVFAPESGFVPSFKSIPRARLFFSVSGDRVSYGKFSRCSAKDLGSTSTPFQPSDTTPYFVGGT